MTKLHDDKCRCMGDNGKEQCARKERCMRYLQRDTGTKFVGHMCGPYYTNGGMGFMDYQLEAEQ